MQTAIADSSTVSITSTSAGEEPPKRTAPVTKADIRRLKECVVSRKPGLDGVLRQNGIQSVYDYVRGYVAKQVPVVCKTRQQQLVSAVAAETERLLGPAMARSVEAQLTKYYSASTMDHSGPLYHPWALNFDLVSSIVALEHPDPLLQNVITLAFSNVSLNNFAFPRGIAFHALNAKGELKQHRLSFFPSKLSTYPVFNLPAYTFADVARMKDVIHASVRSGEIDAAGGAAAEKMLDDIYATSDVLACATYTDQIAKVNAALWKRVNARHSSRKDVNLVYLEQESIVAKILVDHHLHAGTLIAKLILDQSAVTTAMTYFDRLPEAFSVWEKRGTYLFWGLPKGAKRRVQLWKRGNELVSDDGSFKVALTPEAIAAGLQSRELIPGTMISLLTLSFYHGLTSFGGLGQVCYLPLMHAAYLKLTRDVQDRESERVAAGLNAQLFGGEMMIAFLEGAKNDAVLATAGDLVLYGD
ncbi:MAG TPA: hypothetical protein PKV72_04755, partial [Candidatus Peribacteria bacterium]|nr:hypothetical protein [Candidatus Peribacteria bacterium]